MCQMASNRVFKDTLIAIGQQKQLSAIQWPTLRSARGQAIGRSRIQQLL